MEPGRLSGFFTSYLFVDNFFKEDLVNGKVNANWLQRLGNLIEIKTTSTMLWVATQSKHSGLQEKFTKLLYLVLKNNSSKKYMKPTGSNLRGAVNSNHFCYAGALTPRLSPQAWMLDQAFGLNGRPLMLRSFIVCNSFSPGTKTSPPTSAGRELLTNSI